MKLVLINFFILTVFVFSINAQTIVSCDVKAYVVNPVSGRSLAVRKGPSGSSAVLANLSKKKLDTVFVTGSSGSWIRINHAEDEEENVFFRGHGWVPVGPFGLSTASSPDTGFHYLYSGQGKNTKHLLKLKPDEGVDLLSCSGKWVKVRVKGKIGWLAPEAQCSNSRTTCV